MSPEWLGVPGCTENEGLALAAWEATAHGAGHSAEGLQEAPDALSATWVPRPAWALSELCS